MKSFFTLLILLIPFVGLGQELTYVPDDNFEQTLIDWGLDDVLDDYVVTDSINTFTWYPNTSSSEGLNLSNKNISDLTGIEDFTSIYGLNISDNNLTYVDLSQNTLLEKLRCSNNHLQTIDLSQNILLEYIRCENNQLTSINLENIQGLRWLDLSYNKLKELDLSETSLYVNPNFSSADFILNLNYNFFIDSLNLKYFDFSADFNTLNLRHTSLKCVLVDDSSDLPPVLFTDNSPYLQFTEENCDYVNTSGQYTGYSIDTLSINNVEAVFGQRSFCWDLDKAHFEVPKESNKHSVFAQGHWIGGIDESGSLHLAAQTYRQTGSDFFPGPVSDSIHHNNGTMSNWDRQWKLTKSEIDNHITNYSDPNYQVPEAIITWPAHGDIALGQNYNLAPYIDVNYNNIYDPNNGDYPCIKGDEAIYMIRNDVGNFHSQTGYYNLVYKYSTDITPFIDSTQTELFLGIDTIIQGNDTTFNYLYDGTLYEESNFNINVEDVFVGADTVIYENNIGLEQHLMFYAFNDSSNEALHHSIFVENTLYNRQNKNFDSLMIGLWSDTDLGKYNDDWIGCNVELNMGYSFNGDIEDEGANGYGLTPPAIGVKLLDSELSAFVYYNNDWTVQGNPQPRIKQHYYNYLLAKWKDGVDITYGGDGREGAIPAKFMYPGDSDPNGIGTNGIITSADWDNQEGWTEDNSGNDEGDRRFLQSTGPFEFFAGDKLTINYAFVWSRASEGDNLASVDKLFTDAQSIQEFFDLNYYTCPENEDIGQLGTFNCEVDGCQDPQNGTGLYSSIEECLEECNSSIKENSFMVLIYPNPSSNTFNTEYYSEKVSEVIVTNILGEQVYFKSIKSIGDISTKIDLSDNSKGVYNLTIKTPDDISNHKLILQ